MALDEAVATVETDKVTLDIKAKAAGLFEKTMADEGAEIAVGAPFYTVNSAGGAPAPAAKAAPAVASPTPVSASAAAPAVTASGTGEKATVLVPVMGESITTGQLAKWVVAVGDVVKLDDVVAIIDTDKTSVDVKAPSAGKITSLLADLNAEVEVGKPLFELEKGNFGPAAPKTASAPSSVQKEAASAPVTPAAKPADKPKAEAPKAQPLVVNAPVGERAETRVKMTRMRQRIAERLKEAQSTAAMLTTFQETDMGALIDMRNKYKDDFEKTHGVKLGFMSAFVRAATLALQEVPAVNALIDDKTKEIVFRHYCDVSVAVASPTGLVVPVLRNTEKMDFADIEKTIAMYSKKAKDQTLAIEEMAGGTFTISNGGVFGSLYGTPIINPPQAAILGMHATKMRAVVVNGKVEARPMMYLALTYDHRLIDGREAVTFLKSIAQKIEDPSRMLLKL